LSRAGEILAEPLVSCRVRAFLLLALASVSHARPITREERTVVVEGKSERWRLEWLDEPKPYCRVEAFAVTSLCRGFEYGEAGTLDLVRLREGREIDRLRLTPLFDDRRAILPRRSVRILALEDYDRDGSATEFVLQVAAIDSSTYPSVLIGISPHTGRLAAFATVEDPESPLVLVRPSLWKALLASRSSTLLETACGDHGSEEETILHLSADAAGLHAAAEFRRCYPTIRPHTP
jgi:hypothetical protein